MSIDLNDPPFASIAVFCPQSKAPEEEYLNQLHSYACHSEHLKPFLEKLLDLQHVWAILAKERKSIADLGQGPRYVQDLSEWMTTGKSSRIANRMSGILSLPLLVIIQTCQYFQYLEFHRLSHSQFMAQLRAGGGIQGYCGGLLPAIAIASSLDEAEVIENAAKAARIALAIGAYGELGDDESVPGATTIVVRTKRAGQGDELIEKFPGAYISAVTDPKTISIVGPVPVLLQLQSYAREQGLLVNEMHIRGKVHNPENLDLAQELCQLCERTELLHLPDASELQVPVRSNKTGDLITRGTLLTETVNVILASRCEWFTLLTKLAEDLELSQRRVCTLATFGIGDCVPLSPFHKLRLQITKVDVQTLTKNKMIKDRAKKAEDGYTYPRDAVAVIGASCRLPGANSLEELWNLISSGNSQHKELGTNRFDLHESFRASQDRKFSEKRKFYGNFIDEVDRFDNAFFRTNPKEALNMDPQQRVLLELAVQAMDSSGYLAAHQRESGDCVGCFIGASFAEYLDNTNAHPPTAYTSTGTIRAFLCGKISYYFGWSGPSEVLDTACSSSLVAINRACKAIQTGECNMALTGGVNIISGINNFLDLAKAGFLSSTGQCKPFDQAADGYCRSEGGGLIVLKLLSQALADDDHILGVIPAVSTNQGGLSASLTIPHSPAQKKLYQTVLRQANMKSDQVSYIETHGTGTQAGDPLEMASVREVFGGPDRGLLNIGSLKGNIGHAETAAGVASLLKILAMLENAGVPPQASHQSLNPKIPALGNDNMAIAAEPAPWIAPLLAACVNSYGAGGSNCALICCEGPSERARLPKDPTTASVGFIYPVIVSAASRESLQLTTQELRRYLQDTTKTLGLGDVAFTLSKRRKIYRQVFLSTASSIGGLSQNLRSEMLSAIEVPQTRKRVVLAFGGQTKKTVNMERSLYDTIPTIKSYIDECNDIVQSLGFSSLIPVIFQSEPITDVVTLQCGTFAMQYACAKSWIDAGLEVAAAIGHSFGELTAMVVAGVLSLQDGLKLIATRASLMATNWGSENGTMLAIHTNRENVQSIIASIDGGATEPQIEMACYNAPASQVVVGSSSAIEQTESILAKDSRFSGVRSQRLDVTHGFHSKFVQGIIGDLNLVSQGLTYSKPDIHLEMCTAEPSDHVSAARPAQHARETVHFVDAVRRLENRLGPCIWLEAGMDSPIVPMVKRALAAPDDHVLQAFRMSGAQVPSQVLSDMTTGFWREGIFVTHWTFLPPKKHAFKQVWLPPYQFQRTKYWLQNIDRVVELQNSAVVERPAIGKNPPERVVPLKLVSFGKAVSSGSNVFDISQETQRFTRIVSGHAVRQRPLCPASMYMECAAMGVQLLQGKLEAGTLRFVDLSFQAALGVDLSRLVSLTLERVDESQVWKFAIKSSSKTNPKARSSTHAIGKIVLTGQPDFRAYERLIAYNVEKLEKKSGTEKLMSNRAYGLFAQVVHYTDFFHGISDITLDKTEAVANIELSEEAKIGLDESTVSQYCDTITIDTFIQVVGLLINSSTLVTSEEVYVATGVDRVAMSSTCDFHERRSWTVYTKFTTTGEGRAAGDVFVLTLERQLVMVITGAQFTKLLISKLEKFLDSANAKPSQGTMATAIAPLHVPVGHADATPTRMSVEGADTPHDMDNSTRATSVDGDEEYEIAREANDGAEMSLRSAISSYTGIAPDDIAHDSSIGDLGVDSLAAVELAEELQTLFGKKIAEDDLLTSSFKSLAELLVQSPLAKKVKAPKPGTPIDPAKPTSSPIRDSSSSLSSAQSLQMALKLLSDTSGAPTDSLEGKMTLSELGIDSLSAVELKGDIETAFGIDIEDDRFTLDSTVKEILDFLGVRDTTDKRPFSAVEGVHQTISDGSQPTLGQGNWVQLGSPMEALTKCEASFDQAAANRGFSDYWARVAPKQDELLLAYICEAFKALNSDLGRILPGRKVPLIPHLPRHEKLMNRLLEILEKHELVIRQGSSLVRGNRQPPVKACQVQHEQLMAEFPAYAGEARLMALTGPKLAGCLTGEIDPLTLMFRGSAAQRVMEDYYVASPMLSTMTEQLVTFIRNVVASSSIESRDKPLRILEVGAGFGGTTTRLAEVLESMRVPVSYTFTDISSSLVKAARTRFAKYAWIEYQVLNLESDMPASLKDTYDIIIGTNCVHATTNKTRTVGRLKEALNPQGFLVLSEVTQLVDWYDIVFGLLEGWWLANDGSNYPLQPPASWIKSFESVGFERMSYSQGPSPESNTQRLLVASRNSQVIDRIRTEEGARGVQTVVYKEVDGTAVEADIYLPAQIPAKAMHVALMIHGGGHMTLSKKAIRPFQTAFLLAHDVLPVSIDYRLCPEVSLLNGPIADVCSAYAWLQRGLPAAVKGKGISVDVDKIVVIGWSTGGHLAMTTAWKSKEAGLKPPAAILSFYGPTDFESGDLDIRRAEMYPERRLSMETIMAALPINPITSYHATPTANESDHLGWVRPGDPRSELVLSLFKEGHGLALLLNGIRPDNNRSWLTPPPAHLSAAISPLAHLRDGTYTTPTFLIHGTRDEIVPFHTAVAFVGAMRERGVKADLAEVKGARHIHDLSLKEGNEAWWNGAGVGYDFLFKELGL